eukprot:scaffold258_cov354-Prasinococcus_capsulatus_cf.AAC.10
MLIADDGAISPPEAVVAVHRYSGAATRPLAPSLRGAGHQLAAHLGSRPASCVKLGPALSPGVVCKCPPPAPPPASLSGWRAARPGRPMPSPGSSSGSVESIGDDAFFDSVADAFPLEDEELTTLERQTLRVATQREDEGRVVAALEVLEGSSSDSEEGSVGQASPPSHLRASRQYSSPTILAHSSRIRSRIADDLDAVAVALDETADDGWALASDGNLKIEYRHRVCHLLQPTMPIDLAWQGTGDLQLRLAALVCSLGRRSTPFGTPPL